MRKKNIPVKIDGVTEYISRKEWVKMGSPKIDIIDGKMENRMDWEKKEENPVKERK